jgi:hypothetical protein
VRHFVRAAGELTTCLPGEHELSVAHLVVYAGKHRTAQDVGEREPSPGSDTAPRHRRAQQMQSAVPGDVPHVPTGAGMVVLNRGDAVGYAPLTGPRDG